MTKIKRPLNEIQSIVARIQQKISKGETVTSAAKACGIPPTTYWGWLKRYKNNLSNNEINYSPNNLKHMNYFIDIFTSTEKKNKLINDLNEKLKEIDLSIKTLTNEKQFIERVIKTLSPGEM